MSISEKPESSSGPPSQERWHVHKSGQVVTDDGDIIAIPSNERAASRARLIADAPKTERQRDMLLLAVRSIVEADYYGDSILLIASNAIAECEE